MVRITVEVYTDLGARLECGDGVLIETHDGKRYVGKVKVIKPKALGIWLENSNDSVSILYKDIKKMI